MCLADVKKGQSVFIIKIVDKDVRTWFLRIGLSEGSLVTCLEKIPFGPFMLRHKRQEIAVGRKIARYILVGEGGV